MVTALEWRVKVGDGTSSSSSSSTVLEPKYIGGRLRDLLLLKKLWRFLKKAWNIGRRDPRKLMHCIKVGMALSLVSLFYYMRPLYDGVGGNAMWAVMTVVVVFEYTVGKYITHFFHSIPFQSILCNIYLCVRRCNATKMCKQSNWNISSGITWSWCSLGCKSIWKRR